MPEAVSTIAFLVGYAAFNSGAFARSGSAVSSEAMAVRQAVGKVANSAERSHALFGAKAKAISQIWALANECSEPGWDGESANPLTPRTAGLAVEFIRALPDGLALPEFAPEPDGSIALDWIHSRNRLFSLSIGTSNRLAYAWLDGADKGHAVARFDENHIPARILEGIIAIMSRENAAVGFG
jgi:hypothetical protein